MNETHKLRQNKERTFKRLKPATRLPIEGYA